MPFLDGISGWICDDERSALGLINVLHTDLLSNLNYPRSAICNQPNCWQSFSLIHNVFKRIFEACACIIDFL